MSFTICEKRRSVLANQGHCLVMGGPGSGKTTLALIKAHTRMEDSLLPGQRVLFLSFSRAAVTRIINAAESDFPAIKNSQLSVQTFHSLFWNVLQGYGYLLDAPRPLSIVLAHDEKALRSGIERESSEWPQWEKSRDQLFHSEGRVCFDLFAPLAAELLSRSRSIRDRLAQRYPLILVDEAQDTGNEQWQCLELLAARSQIVCLADPDQMIYDFLPGVGPERINKIRQALHPHEIDLEKENNRSPKTEIATFGRDVLKSVTRASGYKGISRLRYRSGAEDRDKAIRRSVGMILGLIKKETGVGAKSLALIASYTSGVAIVSAALQKDPAIPHQVLFDEAFALLASRAAAFLLEPKDPLQNNKDIATLLDLVGDAFRAKGSSTALTKAVQCFKYAAACRAGRVPKFKIVAAAGALIASARSRKLLGDPRRDWLTVKQSLREAGDPAFAEIASYLDYLVAFARGKRIAENLSSIWIEHGSYPGARDALDKALQQDQLLSSGEESRGIQVMNMHKCKGKQFDGVVLYRQQYHSPFVWRNETFPHTASRRLLHMTITRARSHVLILDDVFSACPIVDGYTL